MKKYTTVLGEAQRLHEMGFAIHWLRPKSKVPLESGWTTGPRKEWAELEKTYTRGLNIGVRLGTPSKLTNGYLCVIDVDIKSTEKRHRLEAKEAVQKVLGILSPPIVASGRGNGSRHYYCLSAAPFKGADIYKSQEIVKANAPSKKPSKAELEQLSAQEIKEGVRLMRAWEVSLLSEGRQVVLPPSIHPDSGNHYQWAEPLLPETFIPPIPILPQNILNAPVGLDETTVEVASYSYDVPKAKGDTLFGEEKGKTRITRVTPASNVNAGLIQEKGPVREADWDPRGFPVKGLELSWLPISDEIRDGIIDGAGVEDRSGFLLRASSALFSAELSTNEVLTILTEPSYFLGACGYEHAKTKSRRRAAAWVYRYTVKRIGEERSGEGVFSAATEIPKPRASTGEDLEGELGEWDQKIVRTANGKGPPIKSMQNVVLILTNAISPILVQRDEFATRDTFGCDTPWGAKSGRSVSDDDVARIKYWFGVNHQFEPSTNTISEALIEIACRNGYDPVKAMLDTLAPWDGVERLDGWLAKNFNAQGPAEYLAQVFRKWMVAMVMRVYRPGSKFDWMPIFEGAQGIGKSSFGRLLVGDKFFLDWLPSLNDKDSAIALQGMWGVEMGELSQFRRNELENIKAFVTRTIDKVRPPYGKRMIESPRRCVFFGTTNRDQYLIDETGNRRFKPIVVGALNFKALEKDREQLFAEAKWLFENGKETELTLTLTEEAHAFEHEIHKAKMIEDDSHIMEDMMLAFVEKVDKNEIAFNLTRFGLAELFTGLGPFAGHWKMAGTAPKFAAKMLERLGAIKITPGNKKLWVLKSRVTPVTPQG